ncbi:hypothetical protein BGZ60DRAFT_407385 [Tricladium varicosporioides]|nr:hypothetical protein BGZ60DRAFT_407385 [Hymenoscyphus varicosporioides]
MALSTWNAEYLRMSERDTAPELEYDHGWFEGTRSRAKHCIHCDHQCLWNSATCCDCSNSLVEKKTYPIRPLNYYIQSPEIVEPREVPTFPRFRDLPAELRHVIWELVLPGPRIVRLEAIQLKSLRSEVGFIIEQYGWKSQSIVPHMEICREARDIASKHYTYAFAPNITSKPPGIWFDFRIDTLYLDFGFNRIANRHYLLEELCEDVEKVKYLAVFLAPPLHHQDEPRRYFERQLCDIGERFTSLEKLTLVARRHGTLDCTNLTFLSTNQDIDSMFELYSKHYDHGRHSIFLNDVSYSNALRASMSPDDADGWIKRKAGMKPLILREIITTSHIVRRLEQARELYMQRRKQHLMLRE